VTLGEEAPSLSTGAWHLGKRSPSPSARAWHSGKTFFKFLANDSVQCCRQMQISFCECPSSPSVALGEDGFPRVPPFAECHGFCNTWESPSSPSAFLPRVPDFWHSGKSLILGKFQFSRSALGQIPTRMKKYNKDTRLDVELARLGLAWLGPAC
jgi:hypothetical protein